MKRHEFTALVVGCLVACSGTTVPVAEPQPTTETVEPAPEPESSPESELAPETEPAPTPESASVPAAPSCVSASIEKPICEPRDAAIPPGFWCAEFRRSKDDEVPLTVCYSTNETCAKLRKEGLDTGALVSECRTGQTAYCFTMTDAPKQRVHWRCYDAMENCRSLRKAAMEKFPKLQIGECRLTNSAQVENKP